MTFPVFLGRKLASTWDFGWCPQRNCRAWRPSRVGSTWWFWCGKDWGFYKVGSIWVIFLRSSILTGLLMWDSIPIRSYKNKAAFQDSNRQVGTGKSHSMTCQVVRWSYLLPCVGTESLHSCFWWGMIYSSMQQLATAGSHLDVFNRCLTHSSLPVLILLWKSGTWLNTQQGLRTFW